MREKDNAEQKNKLEKGKKTTRRKEIATLTEREREKERERVREKVNKVVLLILEG